MGFEPAKPNSFRATVRGEAVSPVVAEKRAKNDRAAEGLGGLSVERVESRSSNQRSGDRHRLTAEQASVRRNGRDRLVELVNLSRGGAMVEGRLNAKLWDRVELTLGECGSIECVVCWLRGDRFGLEFAHETRVECDAETLDDMLRQVIRNNFADAAIELDTPKAVEPEQKRGAVRHPLVWSGILHHDYESEVARIRNISTSGALIESSVDLPTGVTVYLDLGEAGRIAASVSWSRGNQSGLAFAAPFDVRSLSRAAPEVTPTAWVRPDFLNPGKDDEEAPADQWGRVSIEELSRSLGG